MHEKRVARAYRFELWTAIAVYVVLLALLRVREARLLGELVRKRLRGAR